MMARPSLSPPAPDPFREAVMTLRSAVSERRARRLTPPAPPPPRDSAPEAGEALPDHGGLDAAALPPSVAAWAWAEGDSDDGTRR